MTRLIDRRRTRSSTGGAPARSPLPRPGTVLGTYPMRAASDRRRRGSALAGWWQARRIRAMARVAARVSMQWQAQDAARWPSARQRLAGKLGRDGLTPATIVQALGCVAAHAERHLGIRFFATQYQCAAALLGQRMVEMATGEGKTLAAALAAAAAALGGVPVHIITANDYLARRDADTLRPLYASLGLSVAAISENPSEHGGKDGGDHGASYGADIVYATAKAVAFDFLRDRSACPDLDNDALLRTQFIGAFGPPSAKLKLRGLCMAIVDEADSILIDEALTPLILSTSRPDPDERARLWQALDWAARLAPGDYELDANARRATLTAHGREALIRRRDEYRGFGLNDVHRADLIEQALTALHALKLGIDYLIDDGKVLIVDAITGRSAPGRVWSRGLHGLVALKEGLDPPDPTSTMARTLYQQFFPRYHHLCGLSGTVREVSAELRRDYGLAMFEVPLRRASQRLRLADRVFADRDTMFDAALQRAIELVITDRRAVLLTTDSIEDTQWFAARLALTDVPHAVLNAMTAAQEALIVAQAGVAPRVTVATQMAGRGTDITLSPAVRQAGGLHVLNLQHNRSRRVDRQIAGRAARQGSPGSHEHWRCLQVALTSRSPAASPSRSGLLTRAAHRLAGGSLIKVMQHVAEGDDASLRRRLFVNERRSADEMLFSRHSE